MTTVLIQTQEESYLPNYLVNSKYSIQSIDLEASINQDGSIDTDTILDKLLINNYDKLNVADLIFITHIGDNSDEFIGLRLIYHIRFSKELRNKPIIIIGEKPFGKLVFETGNFGIGELILIFNTPGIYYVHEDEVSEFLGVKDLRLFDLRLYGREDYKNTFLNKIIIRGPEEQYSRHGIANEWGAFQLARVAGLDMTLFNHPKTLFFKYLTVQAAESVEQSLCKPFWEKDIKVLFIDDNVERQWSACIKGVFENKVLLNKKVELITYKSWEQAVEDYSLNYNKTIFRDSEFDLVLLDYRLGEGKIDGEAALAELKKLDPVVPVIIFTASNKTWSMNTLYQAGADGYYVKEHPDMATDNSFSAKNFKSFHQTIKDCLIKGETLKKYWKKIKDTKDRSKSLVQNYDGNEFVGRIDERLEMFLGLLKKSFEQTNYDKATFFYSDIELAFMTLWSLLNDIQEAYFEKPKETLNIIFRPGGVYAPLTKRNNAGSREDFKYVRQWFIRGQPDDIYFEKTDISVKINPRGGFKTDREGDYILESSTKCYLEFKSSNPPYVTRDNNGRYKIANTYSPSEKLSFQIAFILLEKAELQATAKKNYYLNNLKKLNVIRNKLYLTHGQDSTQDDQYYKSRLRDSRVINPSYLKEESEQLFEIVYFLLIGEDCIW